MKVLSFGSLNIDYVYKVPHFVRGGETLASLSLGTFSGGKGLNQSIAMSRAGLKVYHAGAIGPDGDFLLDELRAAGVDVTHVVRREDVRTGHAVIQNDSAGDNCIILFGGANRAISRDRIDRTLACFAQGDVLVIQNEISELAYLVERARETGMYIVLNPSPMDDSLKPLVPQCDLLILNEIEAEKLTGQSACDKTEGQSACDKTEGQSACDKTEGQSLELASIIAGLSLYKTHARPQRDVQADVRASLTIVLTLGSQGAVYISDDLVIHEPARKVDVVDTTAAGDTFTGYFLAGYLTEKDPAYAMKLASAAAAIAVTRPGASPSIPEKEEVRLGEADR